MRRFEICAAGSLMLAAVAAALAHPPRPVGPEEARHVLGGNPGVQLTYSNCTATNDCTKDACTDPNNTGTFTCADGVAQFNQTHPTYPSGSKLGNSYASASPQKQPCGYVRACSNPCSQSTIDHKWYCGGQVGPNIDANPDGVTGVGSPPNEA